ncbi:hypothetical protein [Sphingomonas oligophenolica]|uniref:Uncharacterized protein n=1 Tax=Sphingomonas oligophenolica TaxID=301154 RepID=A0A502CII6_9SPHN|nr:hypothetical protein [Sphingomonas oligophenolica]TPG12424.1 hypothetical protein EAH84_09755 [Sphingomonas oligophenolica]
MFQNPNDHEERGATPPIIEPDAHGQAALMLAESILHALIETRTFTLEQALSVVATAQEIKVEFAQLAGESQRRMRASLDLLSMIAGSLQHELG